MIGEHFWKIVFVIALLVGGYMYYDRWQEKTESENRMIALLDLLEESKALPKAASIEKAGVPLFKLMLQLHNYERYENVTDVEEMLDTIFKRAVEEQRLSNEEVDPFRVAIVTNLDMCEQYGIFEDPDALLMMENGRSPKVSRGAFKGDKLLIGHFVSPTLAPDAKNTLPNLVLTPETVFGLQNDHIDRYVDHGAGRLRQIRAMSPSTYDRLMRTKRDQTAYRVGETNERKKRSR